MFYSYFIVTSTIHSFSSGNILEDGLATQDMDGSTPLHIAAKYGVVLYLDLLVPKGIELALAMRDSKGLIMNLFYMFIHNI